MFKRILKILGICFAIILGVVGIGVGIYAIRGGFKDVYINIVRLYMDDATTSEKEIYTLDDIVAQINCEPLNASNKELEVIISDPLRHFDEQGRLVEGILKNVPNTITAGKEFKLQINKDANGNNKGGVVTLTFRPADNDKNITDFTLKVIVDVAIPNNSLYFAGNDSDSYTTSGKSITMGISNSEQYIYLKSNLVNAFYLQANNQNLKKAEISYEYRNLKGELIKSATFNDLDYDRIYNAQTKEYNYFYKVPIVPSQSGTVNISAKMHRTNEIERAYIAGDFDNMPVPSVNNPEAQTKLDNYNAFLNKYIEFFDTNEESYDFFRNYLTSNGSINLPYGAVESSKKFVFQTCSSTINITAVNLSEITSTDEPKEYNVLNSKTFTLNQIINEFSLDVKLDEDNVANIGTEKDNLFGTLQIRPYIYLSKNEFSSTWYSLWKGYTKKILVVTNFENGKPVLAKDAIDSEKYEEFVIDSQGGDETEDDYIARITEKIENYSCSGFLVLLEKNDTSYKDYITIIAPSDLDNKTWTLEFNVPLVNNNESSINDISKALFIEFEVTGRNLSTNTEIVRNTFSRIFIEYTDYVYVDSENGRIGFNEDLKRMTINTNVQNASSQNYAEGLYRQNVDINLSTTISNYNAVQYKSVMYFVEETSNIVDGGAGPKIASIGKYNFKYMNVGLQETGEFVNYMGQPLVGERLLNSGSKTNPSYYIHAINASTTPAKIFAVIYLSDINGNPIDINGRPININESWGSTDINTIVVFKITDVTENGMAEVYIDSFVDNINFYTQTQTNIEIKEGSILYNAGEYVKRNHITSFVDENGIPFTSEEINKLQNILMLKFLYKNELTLYATNFDWTKDGQISSEGADQDILYSMSVKDFNGKEIEGVAYNINTINNKLLALRNLCYDQNNNFTFSSNFELNVKSTNLSAVQSVVPMFENDDPMGNLIGIKFVICVEDKLGTTDNSIYIKAIDGNNVVNALNDNDYINWQVSKLTVTDVVLDGEEDGIMNKKLYSQYATNYSTSNPQVFGELSLENAYILEKYYLFENQPNGQIPHTVWTNLYSEDGKLNDNLIDISQYVYGSPEDAYLNNSFSSIASYISFYTNNSNNSSITYLNPAGVAQLNADMEFSTQGDQKLHVANKTFDVIIGFVVIDGIEYDAQVSIDGEIYGLVKSGDEYILTIKTGEYFPIIRSHKDNGKDIVVILGEEFTIESRQVNGLTTNVIYNIEDISSTYRHPYEINVLSETEYNPHDYIYDGTMDNSNKDSALILDNDDQRATVSFIKGGVALDENNKYIFVQDENGRYKFVENASGEYEQNGKMGDFVPCSANETGIIRYSKKGITAYLMITFDGVAYDSPITKVISYELTQEPITLAVGESSNGGTQNYTILESEEFGITNKINILAGQTTDFTFDWKSTINELDTSEYTLTVIGASFESSFFKHCSFELPENSTSGARFVLDDGSEVYKINAGSIEDISKLKIKVPSSYYSNSVTLKISYNYQNNIITKLLYLNIVSDYQFSVKSGTDIDTSNDNYYKIALNAETNYNINDIINTYFEVGDGITLKISASEFGGFCQIEGNLLKIGKSYALVDPGASMSSTNPNIIKDYIEFTMTLDKGTDEPLMISKKLRIEINPTYTLDLRQISNSTESNVSLNILNGESLYQAKYLKIYNGYGIGESNLITSTQYQTICNLIFELYNATEKLENGIMSTNSLSESTLELSLKIKEGYNSNVIDTINFSIKFMAYELYYSQNGELSLKEGQTIDDRYNEIKNANKYTYDTSKKTIYLSNGQTINLDDYFAIFVTNNNALMTGNDYTMYAMLYDNVNKKYYHDFDESRVGTYKLAIAYMDINANYVSLKTTNYEVEIVLVETYYSTTGELQDKSYDELKAYSLNNNLNITTSNESITISDYYKFYLNESTPVEVVFVKDGDIVNIGNDNEILDSLNVSDIETTYDVCYRIDGTLYDTCYDFTVKKTSV